MNFMDQKDKIPFPPTTYLMIPMKKLITKIKQGYSLQYGCAKLWQIDADIFVKHTANGQ